MTIFVAAFPLAPFFALLNNVLEMRLDAKKLLTFHRRPVTQRVRDIGVWYRILDCIAKLSVITNVWFYCSCSVDSRFTIDFHFLIIFQGFIIAFTSDFIPRLVYRSSISADGSLHGYVNHSLAYFNTHDFVDGKEPRSPSKPVEICRYPDYRHPPGGIDAYNRTYHYWLVLAMRLAFVVIFENFVAVVMIFVRWAIPDMSGELRDRIRREAYVTNEIIIRQEAARAKMASRPGSMRSRVDEIDNQIEDIAKLMTENLSSSQLDLVMHGPGDPFAPGHCEPKVDDGNFNNAFIESEKQGTRKYRMDLNNLKTKDENDDGGEHVQDSRL